MTGKFCPLNGLSLRSPEEALEPAFNAGWELVGTVPFGFRNRGLIAEEYEFWLRKAINV